MTQLPEGRGTLESAHIICNHCYRFNACPCDSCKDGLSLVSRAGKEHDPHFGLVYTCAYCGNAISADRSEEISMELAEIFGHEENMYVLLKYMKKNDE